MHMADALVSPQVGIAAAVVAAGCLGVAARKVKNDRRSENAVALMGVLGAFVFAAQMINFTIPGTGSSGHIVGGVLLAAILGPWAALITLTSVILIQCLVFADGGLMALGCNILNMAVTSCLIAYPLVFKPIMRGGRKSTARLSVAAIAACVVGLECGALLVVGETELSGVTALPADKFLLFMLPIHLVIGLAEGVATAAVLRCVADYKPGLVFHTAAEDGAVKPSGHKLRNVVIAFAVAAVVLGGTFSWIASTNPDGLEWSIGKVAGAAEPVASGLSAAASDFQADTAPVADYGSTFSGIIGIAVVLILLWAVSTLLRRRRVHLSKAQSPVKEEGHHK
ncbi:MAG: energy-coupling factor ABC transporter permease [Muribaculaceae bacterium]|nr:energy-coupling factor ABC transporter permease [Muribaculaceae bacterium]